VNFASQHRLQVEAFAAQGTFILSPKRWGALISRYLFDNAEQWNENIERSFLGDGKLCVRAYSFKPSVHDNQ